jgi:hypothetical protein
MPQHTLPDTTDTFHLTERPADTSEFDPLPPGVTLEHAVVVRAHAVSVGDLVFADFTGGSGLRAASHLPVPFVAHPGASCASGQIDECVECDDWSGVGSDRIIRLMPAEDGMCSIEFRNAPLAIVRADVVKRQTADALYRVLRLAECEGTHDRLHALAEAVGGIARCTPVGSEEATAQPYLDAEDSLRTAARLAADLSQPIRAALADFVTHSGHGVQRTLLAAYGPLLAEMSARQPTTRGDTDARAWRIAMDETVVALAQLPGQDSNAAYEAVERAVRHSLTALARPLLRRVEELHTTFAV